LSFHQKLPFSLDAIAPGCHDISRSLGERVIGQKAAVDAIAPTLELWHANLAPQGRPAGIFLFLGPTGTGKTHTVEALAELLHGNPRQLLRIDCGEYQLDHDVAKLVGAPPGYLGHKETQPLLNQARLTAVTSAHSRLSLVLFDEIEKAAPSLKRLLLGVLDKGTLRLGDNTAVDFTNTIIFATSNVGAEELSKHQGAGLGFVRAEPEADRLDRVLRRAAEKQFAPEFLNRCDAIVSFHSLSREAVGQILEAQLDEIARHLHARQVPVRLQFSRPAKELLLDQGFSQKYGARELRRTVQRQVLQPLAAALVRGQWRPGTRLRVKPKGERLVFEASPEKSA
jgi:ATP-dependent Clp protease ATP-binding subunit ClpA